MNTVKVLEGCISDGGGCTAGSAPSVPGPGCCGGARAGLPDIVEYVKCGLIILFSSSLRIPAVMLAILLLNGSAWGGELRLYPSLTISEEYTDNVFETKDDRIDDFITRAMPGFVFSYKAPVLEAALSYQLDYRYYAKGSYGSDTTHALMADGKLTAVENFLFFDVSERFQRVSLDVTRDTTRESLFVNQSDSNVVTASPYITLHPGQQTAIKAGYRFVDTRYFDTSPFARTVDKMIHSGFFTIRHELSSAWSSTWGYTYNREFSEINDFESHQPFGGFRYEFADKSFLFGEGGYTWFHYSDGQRLDTPYWNAGGSYTFEPYAVSFTTGVKYDEDPLNNVSKETFVTVKLERRFARGGLSLAPFLSEYARPETNSLATRKYGATFQGRYELFPRMDSTLAFTAERYDEKQLRSYTRRLVTDCRLNYVLSEHLTGSLNYIYVTYHSPGIPYDNKDVHRVALALTLLY